MKRGKGIKDLDDKSGGMEILMTEAEPVVYYESRNRELKRRLINEGRCDERLKDSKIKLRNLHASHTLGCTTKQTRNT
jgi:hypothetical protein